MRTSRFRFSPLGGQSEESKRSLERIGVHGEGFVMSCICDKVQRIAEPSAAPL
jgi:hypothetical protein